MLRAGIVGLGWWGRVIVDGVNGKSDRISFVAAHTRTRSKAEEYCRANKLELHESLDALLKDPEVEAVVFTTPHSQHEDHVRRAAAAGKHVYVEKPFTLTAASARSALDAVKKAGVVVGIDYQRRFHPSFREISARVKDGRLGTVCFCVAEATAPMGLFLPKESWRTDERETPVGPMTALGVHLIDGAIDLCGEIDEVYCINGRRAAPLVDDTTIVTLRHRNGAMATLVCSQATAGDYRFAAYGTKGLAETERNLDGFRFTPAPEKPGQPPAAAPEAVEHKGVNPVRLGLEAFAAAIAGGAAFPITHDEIVHGVAAFEAVVESAQAGRPVRVRT